MSRTRKDKLNALYERARLDADRDQYFAVRRLIALPKREEVLVGIVGPYDLDGFPECAFFADVKWPGHRLFVSSSGDRFSAIGGAVELSRTHLVLLLNLYSEGLLDKNGEIYLQHDLPEQPVTPPPLDLVRVKQYRSRKA